MRAAVFLTSVCMLTVLIQLTSAVLVESCGPNAVTRREDETLARRDVAKDCWATRFRCSRWSFVATGNTWETCESCCQKHGYSGGACETNQSLCPLPDYANVCNCSQ